MHIPALPPSIERSLISVGVILLVYVALSEIIRLINKKVTDLKKRHSARKAVLYTAIVIALAAVAAIWAENLKTISVMISVIGAGLVVALGDLFLSIAGWFVILTRRPFGEGDRIEIDGVKGDVIDIRLFHTSLLEIGNWVKEEQSTGRVVHVANSLIFRKPLFNFTKGFEFLWDEIKAVVTFESDWKKAEDIMLRHAQKEAEKISKEVDSRIKKMAEEYLIFYGKLTPITYVKIVDNGIEISLRYLTEVKKRRQCEDSLNRLILEEFSKEPAISFAYPTYRIIK